MCDYARGNQGSLIFNYFDRILIKKVFHPDNLWNLQTERTFMCIYFMAYS